MVDLRHVDLMLLKDIYKRTAFRIEYIHDVDLPGLKRERGGVRSDKRLAGSGFTK